MRRSTDYFSEKDWFKRSRDNGISKLQRLELILIKRTIIKKLLTNHNKVIYSSQMQYVCKIRFFGESRTTHNPPDHAKATKNRESERKSTCQLV